MRRFFTALAGLIVACLIYAPVAYADVNDFVINRFNADYTLSRNDSQGELQVKESIQVTFSDQNHGILRALPDSYKGESLQLKVSDITRDGAAEPWTTYEENGNTVLRIGDA